MPYNTYVNPYLDKHGELINSIYKLQIFQLQHLTHLHMKSLIFRDQKQILDSIFKLILMLIKFVK